MLTKKYFSILMMVGFILTCFIKILETTGLAGSINPVTVLHLPLFVLISLYLTILETLGYPISLSPENSAPVMVELLVWLFLITALSFGLYAIFAVLRAGYQRMLMSVAV